MCIGIYIYISLKSITARTLTLHILSVVLDEQLVQSFFLGTVLERHRAVVVVLDEGLISFTARHCYVS